MLRGGHEGGGGSGTARRRRERQLRQHWGHEQLTLRMVLAATQHHSAPWGQRMARTREGGGARRTTRPSSGRSPPPGGWRAVLFHGRRRGSAAAARPAPLVEVQPQAGFGRHSGFHYEIILDARVPRLGQDWGLRTRSWQSDVAWRGLSGGRRSGSSLRRRRRRQRPSPGPVTRWGRQRKKKKRRKKKVPRSSSSSLARGRVVGKVVAEHMGPGEDAPGMEEVDKLIEEKVIRGREFILKHGLTELTLYSDRSHLYSRSSERCWLLWMKDRRRYVRRVGCSWVVDRYAAYWFRQPSLL